jgi:ubiquinone/menaquinone biosynthesis C-methylase UbiE
MNDLLTLLPSHATILEVGAGLGAQAIPLALFHQHSVVVTDIAVSSLVANKAAAMDINAKADISYYASDADYLPFEDQTFDAVLLHATLHHLPHPEVAIQEMIRCLKPNGLLVLGHEPNRRIFEPLRKVADKLHITEKHTQRFVEGMYSVADEETPGFFGSELRAWMADNDMSIEWMRPVWFINAVLYNLPVLTQIVLRQSVQIPKAFRFAGKRIDDAVISQIPGLSECGLFWSVGARKNA